MPTDALTILEKAGGFATTAQLLTVMTRQQLDVQVKNGGLVRVWYGVYAAQEPDLLGRLAALDVFMGGHAVACLGTAAALYGFDTENTVAIHMLDPGVRMRPTVGLMVHQRVGAGSNGCQVVSRPRPHGLPWRSHDSCAARGRWPPSTPHYGQCAALAVKLKTPLLSSEAAEASSRRANSYPSPTDARNRPWRARLGSS